MTMYVAIQRHHLAMMTIWSVYSIEIQYREGAHQES